MASYFIPISLMVLAGFGLGLLVGRLTWGSSTSRPVATRAKAEDKPDHSDPEPEVDSELEADSEPEAGSDNGTVKVWEMEEVVPLDNRGANMPPIKPKPPGLKADS